MIKNSVAAVDISVAAVDISGAAVVISKFRDFDISTSFGGVEKSGFYSFSLITATASRSKPALPLVG